MEVSTSLIRLSRLCYSTKVLYRLYFCTISFCNFLQIKTHFYCSLYFSTSSRAWGSTSICYQPSPKFEDCPLHHHTAHWLVNGLAHQLSATNHYPSGGKNCKVILHLSQEILMALPTLEHARHCLRHQPCKSGQNKNLHPHGLGILFEWR